MIRERLFGYEHAFDHPVTLWLTVAILALLLATPLVIGGLAAMRAIDTELRADLWKRYRSWLVLAPLIVGPVLLGAAWLIGGVLFLSLLVFREYSRATGLFRDKSISVTVVVGIVLVNFAALDHYHGLFTALVPLTVVMICVVGVLADQPRGYIQRVGLGSFGFVLFGGGLAHLGYMGNDPGYRPIVLLVLVAVELNDVFAYIVGKTLGKRRLCPNTSPNKTTGALGALVLTTGLVMGLGTSVFDGTSLDDPLHLLTLGVIISVAGQLGDLVLSSLKRDLGIKDTGAVLPGHGGLLDRFDSLVLVAPAVFHYVHYMRGFGVDQPTRIITGG